MIATLKEDFLFILNRIHQHVHGSSVLSESDGKYYFLGNQESIWGVAENIGFDQLSELFPELKEQVIISGDNPNTPLLGESLQFLVCNKEYQGRRLKGFYCFNEQAHRIKLASHFNLHSLDPEKATPLLARSCHQNLIFLLVSYVLRGEISIGRDFRNLMGFKHYRDYVVWLFFRAGLPRKVANGEIRRVREELGSMSNIEGDRYVAGLMAQLLFLTAASAIKTEESLFRETADIIKR